MRLGESPTGGPQPDQRGVLTLPQQVFDVVAERQRQEQLKAAGKFSATCADPMSNVERLAVLLEEVGEAAEAIQAGAVAGSMEDAGLLADAILLGDAARQYLNDRRRERGEFQTKAAQQDDPNRPRERKENLRKELVQVTAVALAWLEGHDAETGSALGGADAE